MTPEQFTYWLQGFAEINDTVPTEAQWKSIKEHLELVFKKITPAYGPVTMPLPPYTPAVCATDNLTYC